MACIYVLHLASSPEDIRYVGVTHHNDASARLKQHVYAANKRKSKYPVYLWMRKHIANGEEVSATVLEQNLTNEEALDKEQSYILKFKEQGHSLLNATDGGRGLLNPTQETRTKISKAHKGKPKSEEQRKLMAARARNHSPEARKKMSEANKGRKVSQETRKKMSEARKGKKPHPNASSKEARAKISNALKGREFSDEWRQKLSEARKGRIVSEETKEKLSKTSTGKTHTEGAKKKMSEIRKARREFTPEEKAEISRKISESRKGKPSWNKGKSFSVESRTKMSEAAKRRRASEKTD